MPFVRLVALVLASLALLAPNQGRPPPRSVSEVSLPGLTAPVRVLRDERGVPHVFATTDADLFRVQGWLHANDRFFQMDVNRRTAQGRLAELIGLDGLISDLQVRLLDLSAAAQRSNDLLLPHERAFGEAYLEGVNAWLATHPLPPEYAQLELTRVPPWGPLDTQTMGKGVNLEGALSLWQIFDTQILAEYVAALGESAGTALFHEDVVRLAPLDPAATVPDASATGAHPANAHPDARANLSAGPSPHLAKAAAAARAWAARSALARGALARDPRTQPEGSNAFGVTAAASATGSPIVAGDNHGPLGAPSFGYEMHLVVRGDPERGDLDVTGVAIPGVPAVTSPGQNPDLVWAGTFMVADQSDVFLDRVVRDDPACPTPICIVSEGALHPVEERLETFSYNDVGNGVPDDLASAFSGTYRSVPFRSFGPVLQLGRTTALVLQYLGFEGTREASFLFDRLRARDVFEFREAHRLFSVTASNVIVGDRDGHLLHFTAGAIPLRVDLEAGAVAGEPPWFIRDGSGPNNWIRDPARSQGQAVPFAIVPFDEMPRILDPPRGFVVNTNNDPSGVSLDNDLLNDRRTTNPAAIYYLGNYFEFGWRAGRLTQLLGDRLDAGGKLSLPQLKRFQGNTQLRLAEQFVPHVVAAYERGRAAGAVAELAALAADPVVAEAVARLAAWDFSSPTGILEGYDIAENDGQRRPAVSEKEAAHSVAATLFHVWLKAVLDRTIRHSLAQLGLREDGPAGSLNGLFHLLSQSPFAGVGASGVDFFPEPTALAPEDRRDVALLLALRDSLDQLAGPAFSAAFGGSRNQDDYRWGKLNRVRFSHSLGGDFSIPPAAGFTDVDSSLPGIARDGGCATVNPGGCSVPLQPLDANSFIFEFGARDRFVGAADHPAARGGVRAFLSMPGGSSGDPADPLYASQLGEWLTADHHPVVTSENELARGAVTELRFVAE